MPSAKRQEAAAGGRARRVGDAMRAMWQLAARLGLVRSVCEQAGPNGRRRTCGAVAWKPFLENGRGVMTPNF
jgi:hypothetical protein